MSFRESKMIPDSSMVGRVDSRSPDRRDTERQAFQGLCSALEEEGKRVPWWPSVFSPGNSMRCFSAGNPGIALGFTLGVL